MEPADLESEVQRKILEQQSRNCITDALFTLADNMQTQGNDGDLAGQPRAKK